MEVKSQFRVTLLSIKYAIMREMLNKATFVSNVVFMILNNASFIVQWIVLFSLKSNIGGYSLNQVLLLWAMAASTYGFSHFFFRRAYHLSDIINTGKLDSYLVQPKNVLLSVITTDVEPSALGDILYGYIIVFISGFTIRKLFLFTIFSISGGILITAFSVILCSLSFWFQRSEMIADTGNGMVTTFATYPDGIFKGFVKALLYTIIPIGIANYMPVKIITQFNSYLIIPVILVPIVFVIVAYIVFYKGLRRYSSSNLMIARI